MRNGTMPRYRLREVEKRFGKPAEHLLYDLYVVKRMTLQQVGEHLGVSGRQVQRWLVQYNIPRRHPRWDYDAAPEEVSR